MNTVRGLHKDVISGVAHEGCAVELVGWLVIIDWALFLIPEDYVDDYEHDLRIEVAQPEIIFAVARKILPLGGGRSFIFHKAKLAGVVTSTGPLKVELTALSVQERNAEYCSINLSQSDMREHKVSYDAFLQGRKDIESRDWLDWI
ncbi:hypothetical protein [Pseudomonas sp. TE24901]